MSSIPFGDFSRLKGRRLLITGGGGFIGFHAVERLCALGCDVLVFDSAPPPARQHAGVDERQGDILNLDELTDAVRDCDGIVHLAGVSRVRDGIEDPLKCIGINIMGTANVLEAARLSARNPVIVLASSEEVAITPAGAYGFSNLYGITKASAELCARRFAADFSQRTLALRFSAVYSSSLDRRDKVPAVFLRQALADAPIVVNGQAGLFDFIHIEDVVDALVLGLLHLDHCPPEYYEGLPICSGQSMSLAAAARLIVEVLESASSVTIDPPEGGGKDDINNDPAPAKNIIGFSAAISFADGIRKFAAQLTASGDVKKALDTAG